MPRDPENVIRLTTHTAVNRETGEISDVMMAPIRGRKRKGRRKMYALLDIENIDRLQLTGAEWRVLHRIMRGVNPETNVSSVSHSVIAEDTGMARPNVSRIMRSLRERRIITTSNVRDHRINAHIMYRGSNQDWDIATDTEQEPQWEN